MKLPKPNLTGFEQFVIAILLLCLFAGMRGQYIEYQKPEHIKQAEAKEKPSDADVWRNFDFTVEQPQTPAVKQKLAELDKQLALFVEKSIEDAPFIESKPLEDSQNAPDIITANNVAKSCIRDWIKTAFTVQATPQYKLPIFTCSTSLFGERAIIGRHEGIDFSCRGDKDIPVSSAHNGVVTNIVNQFETGGLEKKFVKQVNYIAITNSDRTLVTRYLHLAKTDQDIVRVGDRVNAGQKLGICGASGYSQGKHLHLDFMWVKNQNSDPKKYFQQFTNPNQFYKIN